MNDSTATIQRLRRLSATHQQLELTTDDPALHALRAGQTLLARLIDPDTAQGTMTWHPYLREQWWSLGYTHDVLVVEQRFSHRYQPGQLVQVMGPVGKPFRFRPHVGNVLLLAYDSDPVPLMVMINQLLHNRVSVTLVLLGTAQNYATEHLPPEVEIIRSDTLSWPDMAVTLTWADQIFAVVARDDELQHFREVKQAIEQHQITLPAQYLFGVFQMAQPCGVGACGACLLRVKRDLVPICTQGPAFDLTRVDLPR